MATNHTWARGHLKGDLSFSRTRGIKYRDWEEGREDAHGLSSDLRVWKAQLLWEGTRYGVTGAAVLEVGQPGPPASLPAHVGLKGGLEVTMRHGKANQVQGGGKAEAGW